MEATVHPHKGQSGPFVLRTTMLPKNMDAGKADQIAMSKQRVRSDGRVFHTGSLPGAGSEWIVIAYEPGTSNIATDVVGAAILRGPREIEMVESFS